MSNKRIKQRLEQIFDGLEQANSQSPEDHQAGIIVPKEARQTKRTPVVTTLPTGSNIVKSPLSAPEKGTRPLPPLTQEITELEQADISTSLAVPFRVDAENWAVLEVKNPDQPRYWSEDEHLLVKQVTDQLSLALENARLFQEAQQLAGELGVLNEMGRELSAQLNLTAVSELVYKYTSQLMNTDMFHMCLYSPETQQLSFPYVSINQERSFLADRGVGSDLTDYVLKTKVPLLLSEHLMLKTRSLGMTEISTGIDETPASWLGAPLLIGEKILGVVVVQSTNPQNAFNQHHQGLLVSIANQVAVAIQNVQLFDETQKHGFEVEILNEMARTLSGTMNRDELINHIFHYSSRLIDTDSFFVALFDPQKEEISFPFLQEKGQRLEMPTRKLENGLTDYILRRGESLLIEDNSAEKTSALGVDVIGSVSKCWLGVPMMFGNRPIGVIAIESYTDPYAFDYHSRSLLISIASQSAVAIENARLFSETAQRNEELSTLNEIIGSAATTLDLKEILTSVLEKVIPILGLSGGLITLYNQSRKKLERIIRIGLPGKMPSDPSAGIENTLCNVVFESGDVLAIEDFRQGAPIDVSEEIKAGILSYLGVPLEAPGKILGTLCGFRRDPGPWEPNSISLLRTIGRQIGFTIENANLFRQTQARAEEAAAINDLGRALASRLELDQVLEEVYHGVSRLLDTTNFYIALYDSEKDENVFALNITESTLDKSIIRLPAGKGITGYIVRNREHILIKDGADKWMRSKGLTTVGEPAKSWMGVPLLSGDQVLGVMAVQDYREFGLYDEHDLEVFSAIANQASISIQNARLFETEQRRRQIADSLSAMARTISSSLELKRIAEIFLEEIGKLISFDSASVQLIREGNRSIIGGRNIKLEETSPEGAALLWRPIFTDTLISGVVNSKEPVIIPETRLDERWSKNKDTERVRSWLAAPLVAGDEVVGIITLDNEQPNTFNDETALLVSAFASQAGIAIQNANLFEQIRSSESRFRDVADISADYVWECDLNMRYTYHSERVAEVLGYTPEEMLGKTDTEFTPVGEADRADTYLREQIALHGRLTDMENRIITKDGREVIVLTNAVPILGEGGRLIGYRGVDKDITERKYSEQIQDALNSISGSALSAPDINSFLQSLHGVLQTIMPAQNMYVALFDEQVDLISFPFFTDEHFHGLMPPRNPGKDLFTYVLRTKKPLLATPEVIKRLKGTGEVVNETSSPLYWLGVPLRSGAQMVGVISVQTYSEDSKISERDRDTLSFIANQVAVAIERKQSELELRALFSSMNDVIVVYNKEGRYLRIAPTNPDRLFRPSDILLGKTIIEALPPETHEPFMNAISTALNTGQTVKLEYPLELENNTYWFDASVSKLNEDQVFWIARDVTERRKFEDTLQRKNEYLAISSEIGRLVTSTLDLDVLFSRTVQLIRERFGFYYASIFITEEAGFNAVLRSATGKAGEEMLSRGHSLQIGSRSIVGTVTSNGNPLVVNNTTTDPIHRPNPLLPETRSEAAIPLRIGTRIIGALDIQSTEIDAFKEDDINVLLILADQVAVAIDNARSYELAQQAITEMRELDQLKSQFLANMSHELRTPLNSIIGFSRVILKGIDGPITELQDQDLNAIYNSGQHLLRLINDILDLSKIDAGKMELAFDNVNIPELIQNVIPTIGGLIKDKSVRIIQDIPAEIPSVRADAVRIRQVMINLLSNAAKFTEEGLITISANVQIGVTREPEIIVRVTDTGPGIALDDQKKLFQPFSQVDSSPTRKTGGTGLGLSISRRLVELHGGKIGVFSEPNKGSTFFFTLPLPREHPGQEISFEGLAGAKLILAVDDDPQVIKLYERYLRPQGFQVIAVTDSASALERARQIKPFAITLDIMMPGKDGWTVLQEIKNDPETKNIPVIVCSILEENEKGFSLGAAEYLLKPILEVDLLNALSRLNNENNIHNVLLIDDDPDDLRLVAKILENGGYNAEQAQGGDDGWAQIVNHKPDAIILDLFMPDMNGFMILENLRSDPELCDLPVIIVTGADLSTDQRDHLSEFSKNLLQKGSFDEKELLSVLERTLMRIKLGQKG